MVSGAIGGFWARIGYWEVWLVCLFKNKLFLATLMVAGVVAVVYFDLWQVLTVESLRQQIEVSPASAYAVYFFALVVVSVLNIPGSGPLTFISGAAFGMWWGIVLTSFATAIGGTLAFLVARGLAREWAEKRFSQALEKVNRGLEEGGSRYLFTLRLIPMVPFFAVNSVFGLTHMRIRTFYFVTQLGMIPGTIVYVNAGAELGAIESLSLSAIFTPNILLAFAALLVFPYITHYFAQKWPSSAKASELS